MKKIILILILVVILLPTFLVIAADNLDYTVLAPLPCIGGGSGTPGTEGYRPDCSQPGATQTTTLEKYLPGMFKLLIGLSAAAAVFMIVFGGIQYMTTDAIFKKEEGRKRIENAVFGLVLVISAALILQTINPALLELKLEITPATTSAPPQGTLTARSGGPSAGSADILTGATLQDDATKRLALNGISVNKSACTTTGVACTNLNGLPNQMINAMNDFNRQCDRSGGTLSDCPVQITGGTETYAHVSHGPGKSIVDINPNTQVNTYLGIPNPTSGQWSDRFVTGGKLLFTYETTGDNGRATAPHWHVVFIPN